MRGKKESADGEEKNFSARKSKEERAQKTSHCEKREHIRLGKKAKERGEVDKVLRGCDPIIK